MLPPTDPAVVAAVELLGVLALVVVVELVDVVELAGVLGALPVLLAGADEEQPASVPARPPAITTPTAPFAVLTSRSRRDHGVRETARCGLPEDESMLLDMPPNVD